VILDTNTIIIYSACIITILIVGKIFLFPIKKILKLIINSIFGGIIIYVINFFGTVFNFHIGLNIVTSVFVGILGIPGVILLIIIQAFIG